MNRRKQTRQSFISFLLVPIIAFGIFFALDLRVSAQTTEQNLRNAQSEIEAEIAENEARLSDLARQSETLEGKISMLNLEIETMNKKISLTADKIDTLTQQLIEAENELERQKAILSENLRTLYIEGDVSTLQLLFATDNFDDFFKEQQYLERLKASVQDSAEQVGLLTEQIAKERDEQTALQEEQENQQRGLASKRAEQSGLLAETRGQEANYQRILSDLEQQRIDAEKALADFLAAQTFVSQGSVRQGQVIGYMGNTGYSFGAHLHFSVWDGGGFVDPLNGDGSMRYGFVWPLPNVPYGINQYFGCQSEIVYATACSGGGWLHAGIDIGGWLYEGTPVVAAGDGNIVFNDWYGGYGNVVVIDHGNGVQTWYAHLLD